MGYKIDNPGSSTTGSVVSSADKKAKTALTKKEPAAKKEPASSVKKVTAAGQKKQANFPRVFENFNVMVSKETLRLFKIVLA
jgi:hypothetical protein